MLLHVTIDLLTVDCFDMFGLTLTHGDARVDWGFFLASDVI